MEGPGIGSAKPPGESKNGDDGRHNDRQHDGDGIDQDGLFSSSDRALGSQYPYRAGGEQRAKAHNRGQAPCIKPPRPDRTHSKSRSLPMAPYDDRSGAESVQNFRTISANKADPATQKLYFEFHLRHHCSAVAFQPIAVIANLTRNGMDTSTPVWV